MLVDKEDSRKCTKGRTLEHREDYLVRLMSSQSSTFRRALLLALTFVAAGSGCGGTTEPPPAWATLALVSGDKQTVTIGTAGPLTDFPEAVVVRLDSLGAPLAGGELRVAVHMSGAPGPNGPYPFMTSSDGTASMQLVISNIPGPVSITVSYVKCIKPGFLVGCDQERTYASLSLSATAVR